MNDVEPTVVNSEVALAKAQTVLTSYLTGE